MVKAKINCLKLPVLKRLVTLSVPLDRRLPVLQPWMLYPKQTNIRENKKVENL